MQGTVVMLMALSGLGCHNKSCDIVYAPPTYGCFGGSCYANVYPSYVSPQSYTGCYAGGYSGCYASSYGGGCFGGGCYGGGNSCYSGCYGGGYHGGGHGCGLLSKLFGCCGRKHFGYYDSGYYPGPYDMGSPYEPPIFGYALQYNYGAPAPGSAPMDMTPSEATVAPVPANPVPSDTPPPPPVTEPSTPPATPTPARTLPPSTTTPPPAAEEPTLTPPARPAPAIPPVVPPKPNT